MLPFILVCDGSLILHVRIPGTEMPHPNPSERAKYAWKELNDYTENEIDVLRTLTESGCSAAPKLLSWTRELQDETMWVPGGYVVYILMEKLPGAPPFNFWVEKDLVGRPRHCTERVPSSTEVCHNCVWSSDQV